MSRPSELDPDQTMEVPPETFASWLALPETERPHLIDCREAGERDLCRLPDQQWIPLREIPSALPSLQQSPFPHGIVVYCHHGVRSLQAAAFLRAHGIARAFSLQGGTDAWSTRIDPTLPRY